MIEDIKTSDEPFDRLTVLCKVMTDALEAALGAEGIGAEEELTPVHAIVFLTDSHKSGIVTFGYEETNHALADLMVHLKAMFESQGKYFNVMTEKGMML